MGGKIAKYFCVLLLYAMIATFPIAMMSGGDKDMAGILFIAFGAMILGPFIYFDIKASKRERELQETGTKYRALIMELLDEGYIDTAKVQEISQYIRIRYFDKNNELHEEWLSTKEPPKYQSHFMPGQTVEIVENGSYIGLISERSEAVPMPELSEDSIISSGEVLMDRNVKCITKLPVPKDKYTFYKDFYDQRDKNREDF